MRVLICFVALFALFGCGSKPASTSSSESSIPKNETKEQKASRELDEMLVAPTAEVLDSMGADPYPGARLMKHLMSIRSEVAGKVMIDHVFYSNDEAEKIRDFYLGKLNDSQKGDPAFEKMGVYVVKGKNSKGQVVDIQVQGHKLQGQEGKTTFHYVVTL